MTVNASGPNIGRLIDADLGDSYYVELTAFLRAFDGMAQPAVLDKDLNTPPASPTNGVRYIVGTSPTGVWAGKAGQIARYYTSQGSGNGWEFFVPKAGWQVAVVDELDANSQPLRYSFNGSVWGQSAGGGGGGGMTNPMTAPNDLILGGASGAPTRLAPPATNGFVLTMTAAGVAWAAASGGGGGMTNPMTAPGDIILGGTTGTPGRLGIGAVGQVLTVVDPATGQLGWRTPSGGGGGGGDFYKDGSVQMTGALDFANPVPVNNSVSAAILEMGTATSNFVTATAGSSTDAIVYLNNNLSHDGAVRVVRFDSAMTLTHNPARIRLPGAANISVRVGDMACFHYLGRTTDAWECLWYTRADGTALVSSGGGTGDFKKDGSVQMTGAFNEADIVTIGSIPSTLNFDSYPTNTIQLNNAGTLSALSGSLAKGFRRIIFNDDGGVLRHLGGNIRLPGKADITVKARDVAVFLKTDASEWLCYSYTRADGTALVGAPDASKLPLAGGRMLGAINESTFVQCATGGGSPIPSSVVGASNNLYVYGSGSIPSLAEMPEGSKRTLFFFTTCLLYNSASLLLLTGANINAAAGDWCEFTSMGSSGWRMNSYTRADGSPLVTKIPPKTLDATPVDGKMEYDGTDLWFVVGSTRKKVAFV